MRTLHTFGDSHAGHMPGVNWQTIAIDGLAIKTHWIGPYCCATFGYRKLNLLNIKDFGVQEGDMVLFSFGEVDCRAHIHKHRENYKEIINRIVNDYFEAIDANVAQYNNLKTMVFNVVPVARKSIINDNPEFPTAGTDDERREYVEFMNFLLKEACARYKYMFFDVYHAYCDEGGFLNEKLSDGNVHIKDGHYIKEQLMHMLWKY